MTANPAPSDGLLSYELAHATLREQGIRAGRITPRLDDADECRWAREGERPVAELDTVRGAR